MTGIYQIRNTETNKRYIGQSADLSHRKSCHLYDLKNNRHKNGDLQRDYNENPSAFVFEILCQCMEEDLDVFERYFIQKYDVLRNGYNLCDGGMNGFRNAAESREKMSKAKIGNQYMKGKRLSDEWRKHMSEAQRKRIIQCVETGEVYNSFVEAAEKTGLNRTKIVSCCTGKRKSTGGLHFRYADETTSG